MMRSVLNPDAGLFRVLHYPFNLSKVESLFNRMFSYKLPRLVNSFDPGFKNAVFYFEFNNFIFFIQMSIVLAQVKIDLLIQQFIVEKIDTTAKLFGHFNRIVTFARNLF